MLLPSAAGMVVDLSESGKGAFGCWGSQSASKSVNNSVDISLTYCYGLIDARWTLKVGLLMGPSETGAPVSLPWALGARLVGYKHMNMPK
jgi:hypothetical protein